MKYDKVFHEFIGTMEMRLGINPSLYEHHVFARVDNVVGCAVYSGTWTVLLPYDYLDVNVLHDLLLRLKHEIIEYGEIVPLPVERTIALVPDLDKMFEGDEDADR